MDTIDQHLFHCKLFLSIYGQTQRTDFHEVLNEHQIHNKKYSLEGGSLVRNTVIILSQGGFGRYHVFTLISLFFLFFDI